MQQNRISRHTKKRRTEIVPPPAARLEPHPKAPPKPFFELIRKPGWYGISCLIFVFYFWTATSTNRPFHLRDSSILFYNQLTDSLLQGHLHLAEKPAPQLLALPDPYDPVANEKFRLLDASLYRGRYYVYFGIAPVLTLYLPWRLLTGGSLSDDIAVTLFSMGGYVFSCLLLFLLIKASRLRVPWFLQIAAVFALGFGGAALIILRRPLVYEVAVSAAYCFLLGGLYFLARQILRPDRGRWLPAVAAVFLGLAVASRPHCAIAALIALIFYGLFLRRTLNLSGRSWYAHLAVFAVPLGVAAMLIAWYNYARFDNIFEFGMRYQLTIRNQVKEFRTGLSPAAWPQDIAASVYYFLICPPVFMPRFPFFTLNGAAQPFGNPNLLRANYFQEPVVSILLLSPLCLVPFTLLSLLRRRKELLPEVKTVVRMVLLCGVAMFAAVICFRVASARYELDFVPALAIVGLFFCLWLHAHLPSGRTQTMAAVLTIAICAWASLFNVALSINGYGFPLEAPRSATFRSISSFFGAGPDALMNDVNELHLDAKVVFPHAPPMVREALLSTGMYERWDLLLVEYLPNDMLSFTYVHSGVSYVVSPWVKARFGAPQRLTIDYSAASQRVVVRLDETVVIDFATAFFPTSRDRLMIGRMRAGRFKLRDFTGQIDPAPAGLRLELGHVTPPRIFGAAPPADSVKPLAELLNYDLDGLISHAGHSFYGQPPAVPPILPTGTFLATNLRDHFATAFQSTAMAGSPSATALEITVKRRPQQDRFGPINMIVQDQDFRTLYASGTLPAGEDRALVALPPGTQTIRAAFLAAEEGYINFPGSLRLRAFTQK
jgi:hypothetical protein